MTTAMLAQDRQIHDWIQLIRSEYLEMPGLHLTLRQAMRLWRLDEVTCRALLEALVDAQFLSLSASGGYRRTTDGPHRAARHAAEPIHRPTRV